MWSHTKPIGHRTAACSPAARASAKVVADVGPEPGVLGPPAPALIHEGVVRKPRGFRHEPRRLGQLLAVARPLGHRGRNAVRGEDQARARRASGVGQPGARVPDVRGVGRDEPRVREPAVHEGHLDVGVCLRAQLRPGGRDVLAVLLAARVGVLRGGDEPDRAPDAGLRACRAACRAATDASCACRRRPAAGAPPRASRCSSPRAWRLVISVIGDTPPKSS